MGQNRGQNQNLKLALPSSKYGHDSCIIPQKLEENTFRRAILSRGSENFTGKSAIKP
jgi:hypothetical protein